MTQLVAFGSFVTSLPPLTAKGLVKIAKSVSRSS